MSVFTTLANTFNIESVIYPDAISKRIADLRHAGEVDGSNAVGTEANFLCGSFVRFKLLIDVRTSAVADAGFTSNGCGFLLSAADALADIVTGRHLGELHGLDKASLKTALCGELGKVSDERRSCFDAAIEALRAAFADFRAVQIEEFRGEKALICTCFGVTEETIESKIEELGIATVEEVSRACNAGSGCGSCRMLIQEMLDVAEVSR